MNSLRSPIAAQIGHQHISGARLQMALGAKVALALEPRSESNGRRLVPPLVHIGKERGVVA